MFVHKSSRPGLALQLIQFLSDPGVDAYLRSHGVYRYELKA